MWMLVNLTFRVPKAKPLRICTGCKGKLVQETANDRELLLCRQKLMAWVSLEGVPTETYIFTHAATPAKRNVASQTMKVHPTTQLWSTPDCCVATSLLQTNPLPRRQNMPEPGSEASCWHNSCISGVSCQSDQKMGKKFGAPKLFGFEVSIFAHSGRCSFEKLECLEALCQALLHPQLIEEKFGVKFFFENSGWHETSRNA